MDFGCLGGPKFNFSTFQLLDFGVRKNGWVAKGAGHGIYTETTVSTQLCAVGARRIYRAYVPEAPKILDREGVGLHGLGRRM